MNARLRCFLGILPLLLLSGCVSLKDSSVHDGTFFPDDGTKGKAFLLQTPKELFTRGFRDGKLALVNIIDITGKFGVSELQYGLVALTHPLGTPIPNPDVAAHVHVGDFIPSIGNIPVDHSGWPYYVRVQNFSKNPRDLLDLVIACEPKPDLKMQFSEVNQMGMSFSNPYTCNLNPYEVYGKLWGLQINDYAELLTEGSLKLGMPGKLMQLRKVMDRFNATVIDKVKQHTR